MNTPPSQGETINNMICLKSSDSCQRPESWGYFMASPIPSICLQYLPDAEVLCPSCELTPSPPEVGDVAHEWFESQFTLGTRCSASFIVNKRPGDQTNILPSSQDVVLLEKPSRSSARQPEHSVQHDPGEQIQSFACDINFSFRSRVLTNERPQSNHVSKTLMENTPSDPRYSSAAQSSIPDDSWTNISGDISSSESLESVVPSSQPLYQPLSPGQGKFLSGMPFSCGFRTSTPKSMRTSSSRNNPTKTDILSNISNSRDTHSKAKPSPSKPDTKSFSSQAKPGPSKPDSPSNPNICSTNLPPDEHSLHIDIKPVLGYSRLIPSSSKEGMPHMSFHQLSSNVSPKCQSAKLGLRLQKKHGPIKVYDYKETKLPPGMTMEMMKKLQRAIPFRKKRKRRKRHFRTPYECALCHKTPIAAETSRMCGHVCCKLCWKEVTKTSRKCPKCDALFSRKLIIRNLLG